MYTNLATLSLGRHAQPLGDSSSPSFRDGSRQALTVDTAKGTAQESCAEQVVGRDLVELMQEIDGLRRRLATQPTIEQAKGVLVGFYGIDAEVAFAVLVRWSQHTNTKLHLLAAGLVNAASRSTMQPYAELGRFIDQLPQPGLNDPADKKSK